MKQKTREAVQSIGARKSDLSAVELHIEDVRGGRHVFMLMPSYAPKAVEFLQKYVEAVPALELSAAEPIPLFAGAKRVLEKFSAVSRSQSGAYAVWVEPTEKAIVLALKDSHGGAEGVMDVAGAQQMIEHLQTAIATVESAASGKH